MLTPELLNENHHLDIPDSTINNEIYNLANDIKQKPGFNPNVDFNPDIHLAYDSNQILKKMTFKDLNIDKTHVPIITETASVEPFNLFTKDAIDLMKYEVFGNEQLIRKYGRLSSTGSNTSALDINVSGFVEDAPFCKSAWSHPETLKIFSSLMGIDLFTPHTFSKGHINASFTPRPRDTPPPVIDNSIDYEALKKKQNQNGDIPSSLNWHYDSVPVVCVMMLSSPPNMIGGETAIRDGEENVIRVENPTEGQGTLLQARVIKHIATKPLNNVDRISYVISLHPKDPNIHDSTVATSERPGAVATFTNNRFYPHFVNYRMDRIKQRMELYQNKLMQGYKTGAHFDQIEAIEIMKDMEDYLHRTWQDFEAISDTPYPPPLFGIPYKDL